MKRIFILTMLVLAAACATAQKSDVVIKRKTVKTVYLTSDWANHSRYAEANAALAQAPAVVFMGNSITDNWGKMRPDFFASNNFACRGISGQVTAQMLARFRADVIDLHPKAVVILAGTNDIAFNNGTVELEHILDNIVSMAELAKAHKIKVILASVLPAKAYRWRPEAGNPTDKIAALNAMLKEYALANGCKWVDFTPALAGKDGGLDERYTNDGVHPLPNGYEVMETVIASTLCKYMRKG